jgi:hypothetical protein
MRAARTTRRFEACFEQSAHIYLELAAKCESMASEPASLDVLSLPVLEQFPWLS